MAQGYKKDGDGLYHKDPSAERKYEFRYQKYDDETREKVFAGLYSGQTISKVSRESGVPRSTIYYWLTVEKDVFEELRENKKVEFIDRGWENVFKALSLGMKMLESAAAADIPLAMVPLKDVSTFIGTIYDKIALASGDATSRSDNTNKVSGPNGGPVEVTTNLSNEDKLAFIMKVASEKAEKSES